MGTVMRLVDAVQRLDLLDEEATIYAAAPWTGESEAIVAREPDGQLLPHEAIVRGLTYFLEVIVARDFLEDWSAGLDTGPTLQQKCERLIAYATNDA
jgi:hypothetical protein